MVRTFSNYREFVIATACVAVFLTVFLITSAVSTPETIPASVIEDPFVRSVTAVSRRSGVRFFGCEGRAARSGGQLLRRRLLLRERAGCASDQPVRHPGLAHQ
jgi:hypothetical protein